MAGQRRIVIDVTSTANTDLNTGIQRVVRRIVEHADSVGKELGVSCIPVQFVRGRLIAAPKVAGRPSWDDRLFGSLGRSFHGGRERLRKRLRAISPNVGESADRFGRRLRKLLYPKSLAAGAEMAYWSARGRRIDLTSDDVLLALDATWVLKYPEFYRMVRSRGCRVSQVIYDLIPVTHPEFFETRLSETFVEWLRHALTVADEFRAISATVRDQLRQLRHVEPRLRTDGAISALRDEDIHAFPLGADLQADDRPATARESLRTAFDGDEPVFCNVGTIEPRKNHLLLLDAMDDYWQAGGRGRLVLAGRIGWKCRDLETRLRSHAEAGRRLFWLDDATDEEVRYLYRRSRALVYPSIVEGYGLPIIEALHQGTEVLASDTPIHREVGGDRVSYFALGRTDELVARLGEYASTPKDPRRTSGFRVPTWKESCRGLLEGVLRSADRAGDGARPAEGERRRAA